jgi:type I restriction enzyme S subunit
MRNAPSSRTIGQLFAEGAIVAIQDGNHGGTHPKASEYVADGIPFVMASDIRDGRLWVEECKRLTKERADKLRIGFSEQGDVLLTHKGTVGEVAIVPEVPHYVMLTPQVTYYRTNPSKIDARYLAFAFRDTSFQSQLYNISAQSTRPYVAISTQRHLSIQWHPIEAQHRIASLLGAYDDLIEVNRRRVAVLEEMARGLFEEWFVRFRFPGHESQNIIETANGPLPEGWRWENFGALAADCRDAVSPSDLSPETTYVGLEHIPRRSFSMDAFGRADEVASLKLRFRRGDVLFGKIRPYFHKVAWAPCDGVASSDAIVYRSKHPDRRALTLLVASSDRFVAHAVQTSNGTKMPRANPSVLQAYKVALGGDELVRRFDALAMPLIELAASLQASSASLAAARDHLLPRLITGELSVETADREVEAAA